MTFYLDRGKLAQSKLWLLMFREASQSKLSLRNGNFHDPVSSIPDIYSTRGLALQNKTACRRPLPSDHILHSPDMPSISHRDEMCLFGHPQHGKPRLIARVLRNSNVHTTRVVPDDFQSIQIAETWSTNIRMVGLRSLCREYGA